MNEVRVPATATHIRDRSGAAGHSGKLFRVLGTARGRVLSQAGGPWGGAGFRAQVGCGVLQGAGEPGGGFQTAQCHDHLGLEHLLSAAAGRTDWGSGGCFQPGRPFCHPDGAAGLHAAGPHLAELGAGGRTCRGVDGSDIL